MGCIDRNEQPGERAKKLNCIFRYAKIASFFVHFSIFCHSQKHSESIEVHRFFIHQCIPLFVLNLFAGPIDSIIGHIFVVCSSKSHVPRELFNFVSGHFVLFLSCNIHTDTCGSLTWALVTQIIIIKMIYK